MWTLNLKKIWNVTKTIAVVVVLVFLLIVLIFIVPARRKKAASQQNAVVDDVNTGLNNLRQQIQQQIDDNIKQQQQLQKDLEEAKATGVLQDSELAKAQQLGSKIDAKIKDLKAQLDQINQEIAENNHE